MLVIPQDGALRLIFQHEHARLSGRMAALWREEHIAHRERRSEVLEAVGGHDEGWQAADSSGFLDTSTGRPASFLELPYQVYPPLWTESISRAEKQGPLAGYLVARHFASLASPRAGTSAGSEEMEGEAALRAFHSQAQETMERLAARISPPASAGPYLLAEGALDNDFRFLQMNDLISLVVCGGHAEPELVDYLRGSLVGSEALEAELTEPHTLKISPWVFGPERVKDAVAIYSIADRPYPDPESLERAIAKAQATHQPVVIEPL